MIFPSSGSHRAPRFSIVRLLQRLDQFRFGHPRTALDAEPTGQLVQVPLGSVRIDSAGGRTVCADATLGLLVGGAGALLRLPAVADLLVRVLQRTEGHPICPLFIAVLLG